MRQTMVEFWFESIAISISHNTNYMTTFSTVSKLFQCYCSTETSSFQVCIKVPVGELIKGTTMNENEFTTQQKKLTGMTESTVMCTIKPSLMDNDQSLLDCVLQTAFMNRSPSPAPKDPDTKFYRFASLLFYWLKLTFHMTRKDCCSLKKLKVQRKWPISLSEAYSEPRQTYESTLHLSSLASFWIHLRLRCKNMFNINKEKVIPYSLDVLTHLSPMFYFISMLFSALQLFLFLYTYFQSSLKKIL